MWFVQGFLSSLFLSLSSASFESATFAQVSRTDVREGEGGVDQQITAMCEVDEVATNCLRVGVGGLG